MLLVLWFCFNYLCGIYFTLYLNLYCSLWWFTIK